MYIRLAGRFSTLLRIFSESKDCKKAQTEKG